MAKNTVTILIIDNHHNSWVAKIIEQAENKNSCISSRFQLIQIANLSEAIAVFATEQINLILVVLPENDPKQLEIISQLRTIVPEIPSVVLSDSDDEEIALKAVSMGAQDYIVKEIVTPEMLRRRLLCAIARHESKITGTKQHFSGVANRISNDKWAAKEAINQAKNQFLATMSHELRTPINAIMGLSEVLIQEVFGSLNPKQEEFIQSIYSTSEQLRELVNNILDFSQIEAGNEQLTLSKLQVSELCNYVLSTVADSAYDKQLQLKYQIDVAADICIADVQRLQQMLLNLLNNAIKFTPSGEVSLKVKKVKQGITFTVEDTGIGIAQEDLQYLFQPFQQLDSQLNRQYEGTGLSLALTRKFAQLHGGDVTVESTLGEGSRFTIFLPQPYQEKRNDGEQKAKSQQLLDIAAINRRILIVEDDDRSAKVLKDYLEVIGYQVEHLGDGNQFLQRVRSQEPDLILLNMNLPGNITGLDLLKCLRKEPDLQDLPVLLCTPQNVSIDSEKFLPMGANNYLKKPIGITQLESMLIRYLN
ncbi:MAG: ATP-binding protein [Nostocaceae cyanobacterium]|nr:ATP-binding protein [Nostocaceae cyanobacterium]